MSPSKRPSRKDDSTNRSDLSARPAGDFTVEAFLLGASVAALVAYALWLKEQERKKASERRYDPRFPQEFGM